MSKNYLDELPPELILAIAPWLPTAALNSVVLTCHRLRDILQAELESRITPKLASELLFWASDSKPHIAKKMLAPPHSVHPSPSDVWRWRQTALHVAAAARNTEIATLLLDAGANPAAEWDQMEYQPLHLAAQNADLAMMELLLDRGAPVDGVFGCDGGSESALHYACSRGHVEMIELLLSRGASLEGWGHYGTALGFAVHYRRLEAVKYLLERGADATVTVPLFALLDGGPPLPHNANLLYIALELRHPTGPRRLVRMKVEKPAKWGELPLGEAQKELMARLLASGASKETVMATISAHLGSLAKAALRTEEEYLEIITWMFNQAEYAMGNLDKQPPAENNSSDYTIFQIQSGLSGCNIC
ncbi:ankyrin repeat-containing domain protein [Mycena filopes]|nr:ankyrin repeat-containing domain protein [Mycena filopes]